MMSPAESGARMICPTNVGQADARAVASAALLMVEVAELLLSPQSARIVSMRASLLNVYCRKDVCMGLTHLQRGWNGRETQVVGLGDVPPAASA